jgi:hypothetical protein
MVPQLRQGKLGVKSENAGEDSTAFGVNRGAGRVCNRRLTSGDRTRTCDLEVMSLASYQLLHPAI